MKRNTESGHGIAIFVSLVSNCCDMENKVYEQIIYKSNTIEKAYAHINIS